MLVQKLQNICIIGLGLLGGSLGLAVNRSLPSVSRVGFSHRKSTRKRALDSGVVDSCCDRITDAVCNAQLVVLASPIGTFEELMAQMAPALPKGCIVTDVGSTKTLPWRWARKSLPKHVAFLGSHPMAGSEQRGVDFARADLFDNASCIITPTAKTNQKTVTFLKQFWQLLGMHVSTMTPGQHDRVLGRISHLPHIVAMALINCSDPDEMLLCGKGFLDTTRIASGAPNVWHDILMSNRDNTAKAIEKLIEDLTNAQRVLQSGNGKRITEMLTKAQHKRNTLVERKLRRKELPA